MTVAPLALITFLCGGLWWGADPPAAQAAEPVGTPVQSSRTAEASPGDEKSEF